MGTVGTIANVAYIYKRLYSDRAVGDMASRGHPTFKAFPKEGGFTGSAYFYAIRHGNSQGVAGTFAKAQANFGVSAGKQLQMSRKPLYGLIRLDGEAMAAAEGNKGAFLDLVTQETDGVLEEVADTMAFMLPRDGNGYRGRRSSVSGDIVTLTKIDDARWFKIGMVVVADDTIDGSSLRTGSATVTSIDEDLGTVTLSTVAGITGFANNDYMFRDGDVGATALEGIAAHIPLTAPAALESFRGIDRSVDTRRLAGVRTADAATSIEENIGLTGVKLSQVGKNAKYAPLNPIKFWEVVRRRDAKVTYDGGVNKASVGFEGFDLHTPAGAIRCVSDPDFPTNLGYVLNLDTWYIKHLKGLPHIVQDDGRPNLRVSDADQIEARIRAWWNLVCTQPGANGVYQIE